MCQKFIEACKTGNLREVQKLYEECDPINRQEMLASNYYEAFDSAAEKGNLELVKFLWENCAQDKRQEMLKIKDHFGYDYAAFRFAACSGNLELVKFLWEKCQEDERQEMLASDYYEAFHLAAKYGHLEVIKFLWEKCQEDKRQKILAYHDYDVFWRSDLNRRLHVLDWLLSVANRDIYPKLKDLEFSQRLILQREEIKKKATELDISKFNSQVTYFCKNKTLSMMLLTCKNLPEGLGNSFRIIEIFAETTNFIVGRNHFDLHISELIEIAQAILNSKSGNAINSPEFFLAARQARFGLSDSALYI